MAERLRHVDPDAPGTQTGLDWLNAYISLFQCILAEVANLVVAGDTLRVLTRSSSGTADTVAVTISGYVLSALYDITIEAANGDEAVKTGIDLTRYRLHVTDPAAAAILVNDDFVTFKRLQIMLGYIAVANTAAIRIQSTGTGIITTDCCYIQGPDNSASGSAGIQNFDNSSELDIFNNIITKFDSQAIRVAANANNKIYNNIIEGTSGDGLFLDTGSDGAVKNNAVFNNNDDFDNRGLITPDYNASDDGDGTNPVSPLGGSWPNEYPNFATGDYTLSSDGNLAGAGVGPAIDPDVPAFDIDGDPRSGNTCDIGADEISVGLVLDAESGTFILTGFDADILADRKINADSGSFTLTGFDALLEKGSLIFSETGSFVLTGFDANLHHDKILLSESGTFALTGFDADLIVSEEKKIIAESGLFTLTGFDAILEKNSILVTEAGSFILNGFDATLIYSGADKVLEAEPGSFTLIGFEANLIHDKILSAELGLFSLTGFEVQLKRDSVLTSESGLFTLTGFDAILKKNNVLITETGSFILTGFDADLIWSGEITIVGFVSISMNMAKPEISMNMAKPEISMELEVPE